MKRFTTSLALAVLGVGVIAATASADTSGKKIAFSNNYAGNSWRQAMLKSYDLVTKKAVADSVVGRGRSCSRPPTRKCRPRRRRSRT